MNSDVWDVIIIGGGPAGLSAALILGRCHRQVLVIDAGTPRSWASKAMHAFVSRDGIPPQEFLELARRDLQRYRNVTFRHGLVNQVAIENDELFRIETSDAATEKARKLLIATGLFDTLPNLPRIIEFFGVSVFQCPYCDGWETQDHTVAVYGKGTRGFEMARAMTAWSKDILLCTDGDSSLTSLQKRALASNGIWFREDGIRQLEGSNGKLEGITFDNGETVPRTTLFFDTPSRPQSILAMQLGCSTTSQGALKYGKYNATDVPGVYAAGNILKDVQLAIVAAAEGAKAAFGINQAMTREDFKKRATLTQSIASQKSSFTTGIEVPSPL